MDYLIIYCHPYVKSFNHAVLDQVKSNLKDKDKNFRVLDLYREGFNPSYDAEELHLYHSGKTHDPLVTKYLKWLHEAKGMIIITPVWWNSIPGMLKGLIDKVMKEGPGLSHTVTKTGIHGELGNIKHCFLLTTSTSPTFYLHYFCGNALKGVFLNATLRQLGIKGRHWLNFGGISGSTLAKRQAWLEKISQIKF